MMRTRPLISGARQLDKALPRKRTKIIEAAQNLDDAARCITRAIRVVDGRLLALQRRANGLGNGASLRRAGDDRGGFEPPLLPVANIDGGRAEGGRFVKPARRVPDHRRGVAHEVEIEARAQRGEGADVRMRSGKSLEGAPKRTTIIVGIGESD